MTVREELCSVYCSSGGVYTLNLTFLVSALVGENTQNWHSQPDPMIHC